MWSSKRAGAATLVACALVCVTLLARAQGNLPLLGVGGGSAGYGTFSMVNHGNPADGSGSSYSVGIASTTAGDAEVIHFNLRSNSSDHITSISDGAGDSFVSAGARVTDSINNRSSETWYCVSMTGGITSLTIHQSGTGTIEQVYEELHVSSGTIAFDAAAALDATAPNNGTTSGPSLTTAGGNDAIVGFSPMGPSINPANPFAGSPWSDVYNMDNHSNSSYEYLNLVPGSYTPTFGFADGSGTNRCWVTEAAFKAVP